MADDENGLDDQLAAAIEIADVAERDVFLRHACAGDPSRLVELHEMVRDYFAAGSLLERPAELPTIAHAEIVPLGQQVGAYKLRELLGEGGMGSVYVAEQETPVRRKVALKIIKPGMDSREVISRFEAERQALALMDHPNIAKIFDGGVADSQLGAVGVLRGRPYFVMELVRGLPITAHCDEHRLRIGDRLSLFRQVSHAVQHAHQKGIIHRDLKPSNVIVAMHDTTPVVKVIDFGVAKAIGQQLTEHTLYTGVNQLIGTPLYMSPEQAGQSSLDVDTRSDVYSLGVLLYELLTGHTPFESATLKRAGIDEMRRMIREVEPPRPSTRVSTLQAAALSTISDRRRTDPQRLSRHLRGELDWIVMKALEKDRTRRYESASSLAADIERYLNDEPVQARPPSVGYRLRKFARRNRARLTAVAVLGVAVLALAGGVGFAVWERVSRSQSAEQKSSESVAGARAAIEAGDLALAEQRAAEAAGHLAGYRDQLPDATAVVDRVRLEIEARRADAARLRTFQRQVADSYGDAHLDDVPHEKRIGEVEATLGLYGVLTAVDWTTQLAQTYMTPAEQGQVREAAYIGLVYLADYRVRWLKDDSRRSARESLDLLRRAEAFHPPTRAFYFVRSDCHRKLNDAIATEADKKQFAETPAVTAWDHYLPGHTAGWNGGIDEAIRAYRAALRIQPNHYPSLFFLALRLSEKKKEYSEAIGLWAACIALRPDRFLGYTNRAGCYIKMGRHDAAEVDFASAYSAAQTDLARLTVLDNMRDFHTQVGWADKVREDWARIVELFKNMVVERRRDFGPAHEETLNAMHGYAVALTKAGRLPEAQTQFEKFQKARRDSGQKESAVEVRNLAAMYGPMGRHEDAIQLLTGFLKTCESTPNHPELPETLHQLAHVYERANRMPEAVPLFERSLAELKSRGDPDRKKILEHSICLGRAYEQTAQSAKAIALFEPLLDLWKAHELPDHDQTISTTNNLAIAYRSAGRLEEAERNFREVLRHLQKTAPGSIENAGALADLGRTLLLRQKYGDAEPILRECAALREKLIPTDWRYFNAVGMLGGAILGQGRYLDAEPLLLNGYEGMNQREKEIPSIGKMRLTEAAERLVRLYETTGRPDQARALREKLPAKHATPQPPVPPK